MNRSFAALTGTLLAITALSACGSSDVLSSDVPCIDSRTWLRVHDSYCPIGDGISNGPFTWAYSEPYSSSVDYREVVYVGYRVPQDHYVLTRPARVPTTNLYRGSFPEAPPPGVSATSARVPTSAAQQRSSSISRGGFGDPSNRASGSPVAVRDLSSPAPGRNAKSGSSAAGSAPKPAAIPKAPASRPVSSGSSSSKSGKK
jgi:hypothetical protein